MPERKRTVKPAADAAGFAPLSAAEFRIARSSLGLTSEELACRLSVAERTIRRWEAGTSRVPQAVADEVSVLVQTMDVVIADLVERLQDVPEPVLVIDRKGASGEPVGWWLALAAEVAAEVSGLRVMYADEVPPNAEYGGLPPSRLH